MRLSNTTMYAMQNHTEALLTDFFQQSKDVKDRIEQLILWLTKLRESLAKVDPNDDKQEVERRTRLARSVANQTRHFTSEDESFVGPWKILRNDRKPY